MKEIQYKDFSLKTHKNNLRMRKSNLCQFELTFSCDFHCIYCYSDCYNNLAQTKKELLTGQVKTILDKVFDAGCLWLCLTGGDPLKREDFLEIYSYAKDKGFIVSIFTNGYSITEKIADFLKEKPPFAIELTLNAVSKEIFEEISQVPGSYEQTMDGLDMLIKRKIPLKIKTMMIRNNLNELSKVEEFVGKLGLEFNLDPFIQARLNGDNTPCSLRANPQQVYNFYKVVDLENQSSKDNSCHYNSKNNSFLFDCAAGGVDGIFIDPLGKMVFCSGLREPYVDLLKQDIKEGLFDLFIKLRENKLNEDSRCRGCPIRQLCFNCPGKTFLENGDMKSNVEWFCELAHIVAGRRNHKTNAKKQAIVEYV